MFDPVEPSPLVNIFKDLVLASKVRRQDTPSSFGVTHHPVWHAHDSMNFVMSWSVFILSSDPIQNGSGAAKESGGAHPTPSEFVLTNLSYSSSEINGWDEL